MLRLLLPLAAFVMGCAVQLQQRELWDASLYGLLTVSGGIGIAWTALKNGAPRRHWSALLSTALAACALGWGQTGWRAVAYQQQALAPELEGVDVRITGIVAAMTQRDEAGLRFRFEVESAQRLQVDAGQDPAVRLPPRIQLAWYRSLPLRAEDAAAVPYAELMAGAREEPRPGERWQLVARLNAPHGTINPHGFDYELWLWEQGIGATGYVRTTAREAARGDAPVRIGPTWQHPLEAVRQSVRDAIMQRVQPPSTAGVIAALAVGDQAAIDRADWDVFRATGVAHLMSISGLHITLFAWAAAAMIGQLWRRSTRLANRWPAQHAALVGGVFLAGLYALFSGWGVPAQRTMLMLLIVSALRLVGKRWPALWVWLLALAGVVAVDPWALLSAGFWLSFVAVGILFASDLAGRQEQAPANIGSQLTQRARLLLREQAIMSLSLAPLSLVLFNQVSLVGLLANLVAIPWVTLLVTPLSLAGMLLAPLWQLAALAMQALGLLLQWLSELQFATFSVPSAPMFISGMAIFGALLAILRVPAPMRVMGLLLILPLVLHAPARPASGQFAVLAADVGQGNAVLVQTAHHSLLYDAGPRFSRESDAGQRTLVPLLRALGVQLDALVISHRDADHSGGAAAVLAMQRQARLISSIEADHELQGLRRIERCEAGQRWVWDQVSFEFLHPQASDYEHALKSNAMSCVLRISNGQRSVLLTGDLEAPQEAALLARLRAQQREADLRADVLLVPHHGSKTSSSQSFLEAVQPQEAWVQAGYRNRFQHPAPEVMQRYAQRHILVRNSARCGAIHWRSDADAGSSRCEREINRRYWHHRLP